MTKGDDERWQAYTEQGEQVTGKGITKEEARSGVLHGASHVWIWHGQGESMRVLLQQRSSTKPTWPGQLDISAAGHIDFGETPLQAAVREAKEEIGLDIQPSSLHLLFVHRANDKAEGSDIIENEFIWVYGLRAASELALTHDTEEVDATTWVTIGDFRKLIAGELGDKRIVPHGKAYFSMLIKVMLEEGRGSI